MGAVQELNELVGALVRHEADGDVANCETGDDGEARWAKAVCVVAAVAALVVPNPHVHDGERGCAPSCAQQVPAG